MIVLPGRYTSREVDGINLGTWRIKIALAASREECIETAIQIKSGEITLVIYRDNI